MKYIGSAMGARPGKAKWIILFLVIVAAFSLGFYFAYMCPRRVTPILMYHSMSDSTASTLSVSPENFEKQMKYIKDKGFTVISLEALIEAISRGKRYLPGKVVITFDDGLEDNYRYAFPVMAKYKMPATIFLITGYVGNKKGYMNWNQVKVMSYNGMDFGGHTRNDVYLPTVNDPKTLWDEVAGCKEDIEARIGKGIGFFCYPLGGFNDKAKEAVRLSGYKGACTTNRGFNRLNQDVYELKRVKVTNSDTNKPFHFAAKLSGFYNVFRSFKSGN